jgi:hypothetical protein
MIERHGTNGGWSTTARLGQSSQAMDDSDQHLAKPAPEPSPPANGGSRPDWGLIAVLSFAVFSFAALVLAVWVIWAKCRGVSPF